MAFENRYADCSYLHSQCVLAKSGGVATEPTLEPESEESVDVALGAGDHEFPQEVDGVSTPDSDMGKGEQNIRGVSSSVSIIVASALSGRGAQTDEVGWVPRPMTEAAAHGGPANEKGSDPGCRYLGGTQRNAVASGIVVARFNVLCSG